MANAEHVGQVADGGKGCVVRLGGHHAHIAAQRRPQRLRLVQMAGEGALGGGQDDFGARYKSASAWATPATSLPVLGWAGTKLAELVAQRIACRLHDIAFGGADIHDQHLRA